MEQPIIETNTALRLNNKKGPRLGIVAVILVVLVAFGGGYALGQNKISLQGGRIEINKGPERSADYNLLWNALDLLNSKYVDRGGLDQQKLLYGAVSGLLNAAGDPYTVFFDPEQAKEFNQELSGTFEGIGAEIGIKEGQLVIISPLDGTPAQKAGLLPNDALVAINGETTVGLTVDQAVSKIRGKKGTEVVLTVVHKNSGSPQEIKIIRDQIEVKSVNLETKEINGKKIAVVRLTRFGDDTNGLFSHMVDVILSGGYQGVVLDLRNNPGGYLETAVAVSSAWVENGDVVVKEVNYEGNTKDYDAEGLARLAGLKTAVLVNGGSASASEIVAGALQDYGKATLIGEKTFGKGSVQDLTELNDKSTVKITIAKWLTPKGRSIDKNGLEPDIKIDLTAEDAQADRDPQMDKALEQFK
jgi:carboxyl-terminal processing protease